MDRLSYLTDDWQAVLSSRGGNLIQLKYRRKNFDLLHTPHPIDRELETPELWGVSLQVPMLRQDADLDLESYADGFGARYHHAPCPAWDFSFELWVRYQFLPKTARQIIVWQSFSKKAMPLTFLQRPAFRFPRESSAEFTLGDAPSACRMDHQSGSVDRLAVNRPRASGFCGAIIDHPAQNLRIAYMVDPRYSRWALKFDKRRNFFCAATENDSPLAPGERRTLTTSLAVSDF